MPTGNWLDKSEEPKKQKLREPSGGYLMKATFEPSRLLIVRNDRVGDLVLTMPTFEYVRKAFPAAQISVLTSSRTSVLLKQVDCVDQVLADDPSWSTRQLAGRLRKEQFDAVLVINAKTRNYLAAWLAGIPVRVTWARRPAGWLFGNRYVTLRRSHPPIHESEFALAFARVLRADSSIEISSPELRLAPEIVARVASRIRTDLGVGRPLFGVHPGNYNSAWNWPADRYFQLIVQLARYGSVIVTGGPGEEGLLAQLKQGLPADLVRRVAFYCDFDLEELSAALSLCDVLTVSNTGPMHVASVLGTPVVALFGSQLWQCPAKWAPLGKNNTVLQAPLLPHEEPLPEKEHEYMCRIALEEVVEANLQAVQTRTVQEPRCA